MFAQNFAGISREFTNQCIRSTTLTLLNHCEINYRHKATVSGHRNEYSLSSYCYYTSDTVDFGLYYCVNVFFVMFHYFVDNQKNALCVCTGQAGPVNAPVNAV